MKKRFSEIVALLLILSTLLSVFSVLSFADGSEAGEEIVDSMTVIVNRSFEEGWDATNGLSGQYKNQSFTIGHEELADFTYNHFVRVEVLKYGEKDNDGFMELSDNQIPSGGTVLEYDIKTDCYTNVGKAYFVTPGASNERIVQDMFSIKDNVYHVNNGKRFDGGSAVAVGSIAKDWVHIANVFNFDQSLRVCSACKTPFYTNSPVGDDHGLQISETCPKAGCAGGNAFYAITISTYFGYQDSFSASDATDVSEVEGGTYDLDNTYVCHSYVSMGETAGKPRLSCIRIGTMGLTGTENVGQGFLIDNVKFYSDPSPKDEHGNPAPMTVREDVSIETHGYGTDVDKNKLPTVEIKGSSDGNESGLSGAMYMKVGSDYMLYRNERVPIFDGNSNGVYGAPIKRDGIVYVPFEPLLDSTGYPVFIHDDGLQYDISTAAGASILTLYRKVALVDGERIPLKAAPFMAQDPDNPKNNYPVIAIDDLSTFFPGYHVTYDEMGLIGISEKENIFNRNSSITDMTSLMKRFIFDDPTEDELYELVKNNTDGFTHPYLIADDEQFEYLFSVWSAHKAKEEGAEYDGSLLDDALYAMLSEYVEAADALVKKFSTLPDSDKAANHTFREYAYERDPGKYKVLAFELTNPFYGIKEGVLYTDSTFYGWDYAGPADENGEYWGKQGKHYNDGYDWAGSRNGFGVTYASYMQKLALAYHITGNITYAQLTYDLAISFCDNNNWHNWSQKHHLSISEMMLYFGLTYDWMYNVWAELQNERDEQYSLAHITQQMYRKGTFYNYENTRYNRHADVWTRDHVSSVRDSKGRITNIWSWSTSPINWNPVCNSGIVVGALSILGEPSKLEGVDFTVDGEDGVDRVKWSAANNMKRLWQYGLEQYAPDGSYIEGASYWAYATNYLATMMWAVNSAAGDDLGLYEAWGMDKTFYFAAETEYQIYDGTNVKYTTWMFHDNGGGEQDTKMFFFAADMLDDKGLAAIRIDQLNNGKAVHWADIIGYKPEYAGLTLEDSGMPRDYRFEALEGAVSHSSFEVGATIAGIMGNANDCGNHGQMDSGMFTYVDDGFDWFPDLGSDDYNVYKYFDYGYRQYYYRNSAEGHNQVIITSQKEAVPFGQAYVGKGVITDFHSEDAGMYAILDNTTAYGGFAKFARRGMLVTNNRNTVVIQDEISFGSTEIVAWIGHTKASGIKLSDDKRTAYLSHTVNDRVEYIRVSIVSSDSSIKFEVMTCGVQPDMSDTLLEGMFDMNYSRENGGINERSRNEYRRLVIKTNSTLSFNCAVVIEDVEGDDDQKPVGYKYVPMNSWKEGSIKDSYEDLNGETNGGAGDKSDIITNAKLGDITNNTAQARRLVESGYALTTRAVDFFKSLVRVSAAVNTYRPETFQSIAPIQKAYEEYLGYLSIYKAYSDGINRNYSNSNRIAIGLLGM